VADEIVAKCLKCGREFITEPSRYPSFDPFWRRDKYEQKPRLFEECGGEIVPVRHDA